MQQKILTIIFILLLLVIGGEVFYFFSNTYKPVLSPQANSTNQPQVTIFQQPNATAADVDKQVLITFANIKEFIKKGVLNSSVIKNVYQGYITKVGQTNAQLANTPDYYPKFQLSLKKQMNDTDEPFGFLFDDREMQSLKVEKTVDGKTQMLNFQDLKVGDLVTVKETFDLITENTSGYVITLLQTP